MDLAAFDFADARNRMVDSQLRPNRVLDPRILAAMRSIPRERLLPARLQARAYADEDVPLGGGRVLMAPLSIARLVQELEPMPGERALVVAAGLGCGAAVLAALGVRVTALEEDRALAEPARAVLQEIAPAVSFVTGPLAAGWPAGAPYDMILIEGAVDAIPEALSAQLRIDSGRLATVLAAQGGVGQAVLAEPTAAGLRAQPRFDCATAMIPAFARKPGFIF